MMAFAHSFRPHPGHAPDWLLILAYTSFQGCQTKIREIGGELAFTVEESALRNWLKSKLAEGDWDIIFKAFRLDACMSESLGDGFAYGAYSYATTAVVYRAFVDAHPAVIGWLLNATSQDVETMKVSSLGSTTFLAQRMPLAR